MNIRLQPLNMYTMVINGTEVGVVKVEDHWRGLTCAKTAKGETVIFMTEPGISMEDILNGTKTGEVVMISPNLIPK